jgi:hypothetical protein
LIPCPMEREMTRDRIYSSCGVEDDNLFTRLVENLRYHYRFEV